MKVKLSEYIADFLVRHEIKHVFTITEIGRASCRERVSA